MNFIASSEPEHTICPSCGSVDAICYDMVGNTFANVCRICGHVQDENMIECDRIEFIKNDSNNGKTSIIQGQNYSYTETQLGGLLMGGTGRSFYGAGGNKRNILSEVIRKDPKSNAQQRQLRARNQVYDRINRICYALKMPDYSTEQVKLLLDQTIRKYNSRVLGELKGKQTGKSYESIVLGDSDEAISPNSHVESIVDFTEISARQIKKEEEEKNKLSDNIKRKILAYSQQKRMDYISSACIYIVCRQTKKPITLLDIAEQVQLNVFKLGREYKNIIKICDVNIEVLDPEILVEKYIYEGLCCYPPLFEKVNIGSNMFEKEPPSMMHKVNNNYFDTYFGHDYINDSDEYYDINGETEYIRIGNKNHIMSDIQKHELMTIAARLVRIASKEWINTGRKPQAIVGAAIKISAESMGFKVKFSNLAKVTASGQVTLRDRYRELLALLSTLSSSLPWVKNLNPKTLHKQLPYILQYCEALRELHKAKIDFNDNTNTAIEEKNKEEIIVLSDDDNSEDSEETSVQSIQSPTNLKTKTHKAANTIKFNIPESQLLKLGKNKKRLETIKQVNDIIFRGTEALPHAFVKTQLEQQRRMLKIREAKDRLYKIMTNSGKQVSSVSNVPKDFQQDEQSLISDSETTLEGLKKNSTEISALSLILSGSNNVKENEPSESIIPPPSVSSYEANLHREVSSETRDNNNIRNRKRKFTNLQCSKDCSISKNAEFPSPVSTESAAKKRILDAEDLLIQRLLLNGVDEELLKSGRFDLETKARTRPLSPIYYSEKVGQYDLSDEEMEQYLRTQQEIDIYSTFYDELGEDID